MTTQAVGAKDLAAAVTMASELSLLCGQPPVIVGALALAAHGYVRATSDVDIVIPVLIGDESGRDFEEFAGRVGLEVKCKHGFGGFELRAGDVRIDVLTLSRDMPGLVEDAVREAERSQRYEDVFGVRCLIVSVGHLIALKLIAERKKDIGDIGELIKARIAMGAWGADRPSVDRVLGRFLGWYSVRKIDSLEREAIHEMGG